MIRRLLPLLVLVLIPVLPAQAFDVTNARRLLDTLASSEFEGRRTGHEGGRKAEYLMATKFSQYRVHQGGLGSYFQDVPALVTEEQGASLTLLDHELGEIPFTQGVDFALMTHSGSGRIAVPAVIAGYGYVRPDKGRDDYDTLDVKGKAVVVLRGYPASAYDFDPDFSRRYTTAWARERGAAAVIFCQDADPTYGAAIPEEIYDEQLPLLYAGDRLLRLLLDGTGYSLETYKEKLKSRPLPLETGKRLQITTKVKRVKDGLARNVLGIVYGTDPRLKNEVLVVGAHLDHIGKDSRGVIYNGADDNASGSAVVSELARAFAAQPARRSVMFIHFTGEEDGLLGSRYFVEHPTVPLANIAGMVNLDMEGMGSGSVVMAGGETWGRPWEEYTATLDSTDRKKLVFSRESGHGASDHASFMRAGIPTLAFWSRGDHPFYHSYEDDARWISDSVLAAVGNRAEQFLRFMANREARMPSYADSLRNLARLSVAVDWIGFAVDAKGNVPHLPAVSAAWLPPEAGTLAEAIRRVTLLHDTARQHDIESTNLKDAFAAQRRHRKAVFLAMEEAVLLRFAPAEVHTLIKQGLALVRLATGVQTAETKQVPSPALEVAREQDLYALVPFDFSTAARVAEWGKRGIVTTTLREFAEAPESVRQGLLTESEALLVLEVDAAPTKAQIDSIYAGRARRLHLSFGSIPRERREEHAKIVMDALFQAGLTRDEILMLTNGNIRRFFQ